MAKRLARTGIAAMALTGTVIAFGGITAQAQVRPGSIGGGTEFTTDFYNNAQHTTIIGALGNGCVHFSWGTTSSYFTSFETPCGAQ